MNHCGFLAISFLSVTGIVIFSSIILPTMLRRITRTSFVYMMREQANRRFA